MRSLDQGDFAPAYAAKRHMADKLLATRGPNYGGRFDGRNAGNGSNPKPYRTWFLVLTIGSNYRP